MDTINGEWESIFSSTSNNTANICNNPSTLPLVENGPLIINEEDESISYINSIDEFVKKVKEDIDTLWGKRAYPWFRGQKLDKPLVPKLYREGSNYNENNMVQSFRIKGKIFGNTPDYNRIDEWLFLMQHHGVPTRLLDWTEGALIALFFAVHDYDRETKEIPIVWMLNHLRLNENSKSYGKSQLPLPWNDNAIPCLPNIGAVFSYDSCGTEFPIAVNPQYSHIRMSAQRSCFTVHGEDKRGLDVILKEDESFENKYLIKYRINPEETDNILCDLRMLGISYSTIFSDFDGLSKEIEKQFY